MRVEVYWNLHKKLWSVRALEGDNKGRVVAHVHSLTLRECSYVVQPAGQAKVRAEKRKVVHAFVRGTAVEGHFLSGAMYPITYNPYRDDTFVTADENQLPVMSSGQTYLGTTERNGTKPVCLGFNVRFMEQVAA
ncbi:hypothetical protein [Marinobacter similis]|uniref:Uncharacterized protein n=1 Tax=Marinobacter similis TaxID=1420916 RepID=W5YTB2_9GAMM|nr:hypothetical protein [Marinobacter similis]AHI29718.1 hypothetical protein AU14_17650 [Marinobacter similis]